MRKIRECLLVVRVCAALAVGSILCLPCAAQTAPDANERFAIDEFRVLGNSALRPIDIEAAVYPMLGASRTIEDVERARVALADVYRREGFGAVTVEIPEQDVVDGIVRLQVTEGRTDRVRITGTRYFANGRIRGALPSLQRGEVLNLTRFQRDLNELNRQTGDRSITPILRAGRTPGTVDVELKVKDELPTHGSVEVNDRYTADTSRTRAGINLSYGNLFQRFHSLSLQYQTAPEEPDETRVIAATYVAPIESTGHSVAVYAVDTNSDVATVGTLSVLGAGRIYGARYIVPLASIEGRLFHSVSLGADYKDFEESIRLEDGSDVTPIQYVNWTVGYNATLRSAHTLNTFSLAANFGVRDVANDDGPPIRIGDEFFVPGEFGYKRSNADPNYFYLRADAEHERHFIFDSRLVVRLSGQYTTEPLISNEQFSIGGAESVRGYLESEELGDYGVSGSLEWRTPAFVRDWLGPFNLYGLVFYDAGLVAIVEPLPEQTNEFHLASYGAGLRLSAFGGLQAALDWAYPLEATNNVEAHDSRVHFQLLYGF